MDCIGRIKDYDGVQLTVTARIAAEDAWLLEKQGVREVEIHIHDGRCISPQQRKLIYALLHDLADWSGNDVDWEKQLRKYHFMALTGCEEFSLSAKSALAADMTTANRFIDYLLDECLEHGVELSFRPADMLDDKQSGRWLYRCLVHRKCCVCGRAADIHHVDAVGMGRNRDTICHVGMRAMALCRAHHSEAETIGNRSFRERYHVYGIKLDSYLVKKLNLGKQEIAKIG